MRMRVVGVSTREEDSQDDHKMNREDGVEEYPTDSDLVQGKPTDG